MKSPLAIAILASFTLLSACLSSPQEVTPGTLSTAWSTCQTAKATRTGGYFAGRAVLVWNLHPEQDYYTDNRNAHFEEFGSVWLTDARYFILGDYTDTRYYHESHPEDFFTSNLGEASALLCLSVNYTDIETCEYTSGFHITRAIAEADVKLVRWPQATIIAETRVVADEPDACPSSLNTRDLGDRLVYVNNVDIWQWFLGYRQ